MAGATILTVVRERGSTDGVGSRLLPRGQPLVAFEHDMFPWLIMIPNVASPVQDTLASPSEGMQ